jgi:hypothetical protein
MATGSQALSLLVIGAYLASLVCVSLAGAAKASATISTPPAQSPT